MKKKVQQNKELTFLIEELKVVKTTNRLEKIEDKKENLTWALINDELKDVWYETLGDVKKGLYSY